MIRVYLIDDHGVVRAGMASILKAEPDIEVTGQASGGWQALRELADPRLAADVIILDLSMPDMSGAEALQRLLALRPSGAVLVVSMYSEAEFGPALLQSGAAGYLSKDQSDKDLVLAVRTIAGGRSFLSRSASRRRTDRLPHHELTARELQVFMLLVEGRPPTSIAAELNIGISTVSTHIANIRVKLGVGSVAEIVRYAYRHGLIG